MLIRSFRLDLGPTSKNLCRLMGTPLCVVKELTKIRLLRFIALLT